jgi:hypothetical protein
VHACDVVVRNPRRRCGAEHVRECRVRGVCRCMSSVRGQRRAPDQTVVHDQRDSANEDNGWVGRGNEQGVEMVHMQTEGLGNLTETLGEQIRAETTGRGGIVQRGYDEEGCEARSLKGWQ